MGRDSAHSTERWKNRLDHLFIECDFGKVVWSYTVGDLKVILEWGGSNLENRFKDLLERKKVYTPTNFHFLEHSKG